MKKYNEEHEWAQIDGDIASVGISKYAIEQLGDITFIELPEINSQIGASDSVAFIESVKAASDIYTPVSGEVIEINEELEDAPETLNESAQTTWIFKVKMSQPSEVEELMDEEAYLKYIETL